MTAPFIIYALPRSRTFWLSKFLSVGAWKCGHEELQHIRGMDDIKSLLDMPFYGSAETAAAPWWRLIHAMRPDIKTVVIRRPVADVVASVIATGVPVDEAKLVHTMQCLDAKLDQIEARVPGVLSVAFDDLKDEATCAKIFGHCTGQDMPTNHFHALAPLNLQCDLDAMLRRCSANAPQMERIGRLAKQRILAKMARRPVVSETMTFQQEPFDTFLNDAQALFSQHLIEVGEHPSAWSEKNLDLMRVLESIGALYVTTARSNGRMFGYLMSIVAPRFDKRDGKDGVHTLFYASPDAPGIGLKLQRASVEFLRSIGVDQVTFRAGPRGSGERTSTLFKRLGAEDAGHMFILDLKEVA